MQKEDVCRQYWDDVCLDIPNDAKLIASSKSYESNGLPLVDMHAALSGSILHNTVKVHHALWQGLRLAAMPRTCKLHLSSNAHGMGRG